MFRRLPPHVQSLTHVSPFADLSKRELLAIGNLGTTVDLGPDRLLCRAGQYPPQIAVVLAGEVKLTEARGARRYIRAGECFGSTAESWSPDAEAQVMETVVATRLLILSAREFSSLRRVCPRLATRLSARDTRATHIGPSRSMWVRRLPVPT